MKRLIFLFKKVKHIVIMIIAKSAWSWFNGCVTTHVLRVIIIIVNVAYGTLIKMTSIFNPRFIITRQKENCTPRSKQNDVMMIIMWFKLFEQLKGPRIREGEFLYNLVWCALKFVVVSFRCLLCVRDEDESECVRERMGGWVFTLDLG